MPRSTDAPRTPRVPRCGAHRRVTGCPGPVLCRWLVTPTRCAACKRIRRAAPCVAPWHDDSGIQARGHPPAFAVHPRRPTGTGRPRASRLHVVVQNEPDCSDGTESRSLTSPQSTAKRIPGQVGDSCLQHDALRFGLFSFSCPRLRYIRPTEAIAGSTTPAIALTAHTTMQGAHHASCRKASRAHARLRAAIAPRQKARTFRN